MRSILHDTGWLHAGLRRFGAARRHGDADRREASGPERELPEGLRLGRQDQAKARSRVPRNRLLRRSARHWS